MLSAFVVFIFSIYFQAFKITAVGGLLFLITGVLLSTLRLNANITIYLEFFCAVNEARNQQTKNDIHCPECSTSV